MQDTHIFDTLESSQTENNIKEQTKEYLEKAGKIQEVFKGACGENSDKYKKIEKEYNELYQSVEVALIDENITTMMELENIKKEFSDIENRADINGNILTIEGQTFDIKNTSWEDIQKISYTKLCENQEVRESIEKEKIIIEQLGMIQTIIPIWISRAQEVHDSMIWKSRRKDDEAIQNNIDILTQKPEELNELLIKKDYEAIARSIHHTFKVMKDTEKEESIFNDTFGKNDINRIERIFYEKGNKDEKMLKVYNLMRGDWVQGIGLSSGNSEGVKEAVSNHLIEQKEFQNIKKVLTNPSIYTTISETAENIQNDTIPPFLEKELGKDLAEELIKIYRKGKKQIEKQNLSEEDESIMWNNIWYNIQHQMKHTLLRDTIKSWENRGKEQESYIGLYASITGLGEKKGMLSDMALSDKSTEAAFDFAVEVGTMFIPLTGGLKVAHWAYKGGKYFKGVQHHAVSRFGKIFADKPKFILKEVAEEVGYKQALKQGSIHLAKQMPERILRASIKGPVFHEVHNLISSAMYGNDWKENSIFGEADSEEWLKSALFFFTLRLGYNGVGQIKRYLPESTLTTLGEISAQSMAALSTGIGVEAAFGNEVERSIENFAKIFIIVAIYKSIGARTKQKQTLKEKLKQKQTLKEKLKQKQTLKEKLKQKQAPKEKLKENQNMKEQSQNTSTSEDNTTEIKQYPNLNYLQKEQDHDIKKMSLSEKIKLKNEYAKLAEQCKTNIKNIVVQKFGTIEHTYTKNEIRNIMHDFVHGILQVFGTKAQIEYIENFEDKHGIKLSKEEKQAILKNIEQYRIIQEKIEEIEEEIQKEIQSYISHTGTKNGRYYILTLDGYYLEDLTLNELKEVQKPGKEEFIRKSADFQKILKEIGMFELRKIKDSIISAIGTTDMQLSEKNFLENNQIKIFLSKILTSLGENPPAQTLQLGEFIKQIKRMNGEQIGGNIAEVNERGESKMMAEFRKKFYPPNGTFIDFNSSAFTESL